VGGKTKTEGDRRGEPSREDGGEEGGRTGGKHIHMQAQREREREEEGEVGVAYVVTIHWAYSDQGCLWKHILIRQSYINSKACALHPAGQMLGHTPQIGWTCFVPPHPERTRMEQYKIGGSAGPLGTGKNLISWPASPNTSHRFKCGVAGYDGRLGSIGTWVCEG
jgi:hypothetical protein